MTQPQTLTDADRSVLTSEFNVNEKWWNEARHIARAMIDHEKPELCSSKPWSTLAMGFNLYGDPTQSLAEYLEGNLHLCRPLGMVIGQAMKQVLAGSRSVGGGESDGKPTDDELRDRWLAYNPLVAYGMGEWRIYEGGIWPAVDDTLVERQMVRVLEDAKPEGIRPTDNRLNSVKKLSRIEVFKPADMWDADPDLLVCENGMLHIPTKELRRHDPRAYQTTGVPYAYDPEAECPTFVNALTRLPYRVVQFLQEFAGYCLTVDTSQEIAVWFLGRRGCGKSTIIEGFNAMLGDRAGVLSLKQMSQSRFGLTNIEGKTLLYAFENPSLYLDTTDTLNAIISGEAVPIERKFKDPITIIPRAKILWAMNKLPRVADAGDGLFRRVRVVKFEPLPQHNRDPEIKENIKNEGPGILNWALVGLDRLRKRGRFEIPPEIHSATENFRKNNDVEGNFVDDYCETGPDLKIQSTPLYKAYREWCFENGHKPKSSSKIREEWERLGFYRSRQKGISYYLGLELKSKYMHIYDV